MESSYAIPAACFLLALGGGVVAGQNWRDDWKRGGAFEVDDQLTYSLKDAPLTAKERDQIYRLLDNQTVHDSFTDAERDQERETVLGSRVGFVGLSEAWGPELLVRGPRLFCGASGNCRYLVFTRKSKKLRLVLDASGAFLVRLSSVDGYRDVETSRHMSAYQQVFNVYSWNGSEYQKADCYSVSRDPDNPDKPPVIAGCQK